MLNKKYLPSLGLLIFIFTALMSVLYVKWALEPLSYEKAKYEEQKGHQLAKAKKLEEASKYFLIAASFDDTNINRSNRYQYAGSTTAKKIDKIKYYKMALEYNPNNEKAKQRLNILLHRTLKLKAKYEEQKGHRLVKAGKLKKASKHFLIAANIDDNNISRSNRYQYTGSTVANKSDKIKYYKLSLKYNQNNETVKKRLGIALHKGRK